MLNNYWTSNWSQKAATSYRTVRLIQNWPTAIGLRVNRNRPGLRLLAFRNGLNVVCRGGTMDWTVVSELALSGGYGLALRHLRNLSGSPTVLDLGANLGMFSILAAHAHPRAVIHAFEPVPASIRMFELNMMVNATLSNRVQLHREAVGGSTGTREFFEDALYSQSSGFWHPSGKALKVQVRSFAEVLASLPAAVDVAKVDIEGAEFELLEGTPRELWKRVGALSIEVHDDPAGKLKLEDFMDSLAHLGFKCVKEPVATSVYFFYR
jgi:FkbM family methyltransferase